MTLNHLSHAHSPLQGILFQLLHKIVYPMQLLWNIDFLRAVVITLAASYAVVGAVISEWLGGFGGLGVHGGLQPLGPVHGLILGVLLFGQVVPSLRFSLCDKIITLCGAGGRSRPG